MDKPKAYAATPIVNISVCFPTSEWQTIIWEIMDFQNKENIISYFGGGSGPNWYYAYYKEADAKKVAEFLDKKGYKVLPVEEVAKGSL